MALMVIAGKFIAVTVNIWGQIFEKRIFRFCIEFKVMFLTFKSQFTDGRTDTVQTEW